MPTDKFTVLILGLDGATFDLMRPWIAEGRLPHLARLMNEGASSPLRSTIPPITPCAWTSFMTGTNPGKHGLFDFVEPLPNRRGFRFTNASSRRGETLWGYLSKSGRKVGVINVPMTYPPESVNGYLISGLDTPSDNSRYTYPADLRDELAAQSIGYKIDIQHLGNMRNDARRDYWLRELCSIETTRAEALRHLRRRYPSDFTMLVHTATDTSQHHFWQYMDPAHDKYEPAGAERYRHAIRDVYVHIDGLIGSVLAERGDDTVVMIMSDHGFGPTSSVRVRLNQALEHGGLLSFRREGKLKRATRSVGGAVDRLLRKVLSNDAKRWLASRLPRLRVWFEKFDEAPIDWERTRAYTHETYRASPAVWLNRTAKTSPERDEELLRAVEAVLRGLIDPKTGRPAVSHVYRTRDLYHGAFAANAPDLLPSWWEDGFLLEDSYPGGPKELHVERSKEPIKGGVEFAGSHRLDGVFIMAGGPVKSGHAFTGAQIIDVAPTVLYLMGLPIPAVMDGRPLVEAIEPSFVGARPPTTDAGERSPETAPPPAGSGFTDEEEAMVGDRLRQLGYIE
jgi:predicted AlkP superfamily phosphohydrolase/phosphomutase